MIDNESSPTPSSSWEEDTPTLEQQAQAIVGDIAQELIEGGNTPTPILDVPTVLVRGRMTVKDYTYHHTPEGEVTLIPVAFSRMLNCPEKPYQRRILIGEQWRKLDLGWVWNPSSQDDCGPGVSMILVRNLATTLGQVKPTPEHIAEVKAMILEIGIEGYDQDPKYRTMHSPPKVGPAPFALIPPGEGQRFIPADPYKLYIRCQKGSCTTSITIYPK